MTPQEYIERIVANSLLSADEINAVLIKLPASERPKDVAQLGRLLVQKGLLTRYQATAVFQNQTRGLVLANYMVLDKIGAGGMGEVFKARHRVMDRIVAVKVLPASLIDSPEAVKRFHREVRAAARLIHPHIVTAYDAAEDKGTHFLAMEYVEGEDLAKIVDRDGPLPLSDAIDYVLQAADGLAYAHAQGMIHRDIKPHNLLLARATQNSSDSMVSGKRSPRIVKILDMGLARFETTIHGQATERHSITREDQIIGTVDYMSPEQAEGSQATDLRSDIYSLGCTLYRLLTGQVPFVGDTAMRKLIAHREHPVPKLRSVRPEIPAGVDEALARMMAKRPTDRFASMMEVIEALRPFGSGAQEAAPRDRGSDADVLTEDSALLNFIYKHPTNSTVGPARAAPSTKGVATKPAPAARRRRKPAFATPTENVALQQAKQDTAKVSLQKRQRHTRKGFPIAIIIGAAALLGMLVIGGAGLAIVAYFANRPTRLAIAWPQAERSHAQLLINEQEFELHGADPLEFDVEPGTVSLVAKRYGYEPIEQQFEIAAGQRHELKLDWVVVPPLGTVTGFDPERVKNELDVNERWPALFQQHQAKIAARKTERTAAMADMQKAIDAAAAKPEDVALAQQSLRAAVAFGQRHGGTAEAATIGGELARLATVADTLQRADISPYELAAAGAGNPSEAPAQLAAILGDSRLVNDESAQFAVALDRSSKFVAVGGRSLVTVWDTQTKLRKWTLRGHTNQVRAVAFSPSEDLLASGGTDQRIKLWSLSTGDNKLTLLSTAAMNVYSLVFAPSGKWLASGSSDGMVRIWDVETGQRREELSGHTGNVGALAVSPDGKWLASASGTGEVKIWNTTTWKPVTEFASGAAAVHSLAFHPTLGQLVGGQWTGNLTKIAVWDQNGTLLRTFDEKSGVTASLEFAGAGKSLVSMQGAACRIWDFDTGRVDVEFGTGGSSLALAPDGKTLATSSQSSSEVRLWNLAGQPQFDRQGHGDAATDATFSIDGSQVISGGSDNVVRVWNLADRRMQHTLRGHTDNVTKIACSPDGKTVATASLDRSVRLWNIASATELPRLNGHTAAVNSVQFSPDGTLIATGGADYSVRLWNALTGVQTISLSGHLQPVFDVAFSPDGAWLASASQDGEVRVWSVGDGILRLLLKEHVGAVRTVAFSPDGKWLASAGDDRQIVLVELATGKRSASFVGHGYSVYSLAFTPDAKLLVSCTGSPLDKPAELLIWDVATQDARRRIQGPLGEVFAVAVDPLGRYIATAHRNGTVEILRAAGRPAVATAD